MTCNVHKVWTMKCAIKKYLGKEAAVYTLELSPMIIVSNTVISHKTDRLILIDLSYSLCL